MANGINQIIETNSINRRAVVEKMWLSYYNNILLEKGLITPDQHHKMKVYINTRKGSSMEN